ncbi:tetratricopeptide repeat protein [Henriciella marina]|uniref:tetratricopeptide repeat protein n=1 Tax=Henriciella marina TaxID=453851 RepID=UPI00035F8DE2|nr:tetratricopeptide repeat protein [Henriciella marina]
MLKPLILAGALVSATASAAHAQLFVGTGDAYDCYMSAKSGDTASSGTISTCERALSAGALIGTDRASTLVNMGILLMRRGDHLKSLDAFDAAIRLRPKLAEAHLNRGANLVFLQRPDDAIAALTHSIDLETRHMPEALYNRALAYERMEHIELAYADLQLARTLRPDWSIVTRTLERYQVVSD